jgi:IclR family pca regulon transcriptional regulator
LPAHLIKLGYATTDGRTYSLLPKVLTLGHAYLSSTPLAVSAQPYLDRMSEQLHEACNMATLEGDDILYIARSATTQRLISVDLSVGGRLPAYCTSMGRILLAALDDTSLREYLDHAELVAKTSRTLHTPEVCSNACRKCGNRAGASSIRNWSRACARLPCRCTTPRARWWRRSTSAPTPAVSRTELEQRFLPGLLSASRDLSAQLFA